MSLDSHACKLKLDWLMCEIGGVEVVKLSLEEL